MGNFDSFPRTNALNYSEQRFSHQAHYQNEKKLFDLFLTELYNTMGVPCNYYVTTYDTNATQIFGEDNNRRFIRKFQISPYYTLPREDRVWNLYGIQGTDSVVMYVSKRSFRCASLINNDPSTEYIPKIGDIIKANFNSFLFEITIVKDESALYLQSRHVWELTVVPYRNEHIDPSDLTTRV